MINVLKKWVTPQGPSALEEAERELKIAECEFLKILEKVDYYIAMAEYGECTVRRLREVISQKDVLAMPYGEDTAGQPQSRMH
jgi:hypothetical protein